MIYFLSDFLSFIFHEAEKKLKIYLFGFLATRLFKLFQIERS